MSDKVQWPATDARMIAEALLCALAPLCERIAIAGSLRRNKAEVGDVELLYVPRMERRKVDFFESADFSLADELIERWRKAGEVSKRLGILGTVSSWGPRNKHAVHRCGLPVDFFATTLEHWWLSLVIRTGPKDFNLKLTTGALARRRALHAYAEHGGITMEDGSQRWPESEREACDLCGVEYAEPEDRR